MASSFAARFAPAYLFAESDGTRWVYDSLWQCVQDDIGGTEANRARGMTARTALQGRMRSVGIIPTVDTIKALQTSRERNSRDAIARRKMAKAIRDDQARREDEADRARRHHG